MGMTKVHGSKEFEVSEVVVVVEVVVACVRELEASSSLTRSKSLMALAKSSPFIPPNNN